MSLERLWRLQNDKDPVHTGEPWGVLLGVKSRVRLCMEALGPSSNDKTPLPERGDCAQMRRIERAVEQQAHTTI